MRDVGRSSSGRPLSSADWLYDHHRAKLPERMAFARRLAALKPVRIIDLGCGTGLWLDLLNEAVDHNCEFIGIDADPQSVSAAAERASQWRRAGRFITGDVSDALQDLPPGDLYLCFNVAGYLADPTGVFNQVKRRKLPGGCLVLRQYDGATMRFGPMDSRSRMQMDDSLFASTGTSNQFRHYSLDSTLQAAVASVFASKQVELELFQRHAPFPSDFVPYLDNTMAWNGEHLNERAHAEMLDWRNRVCSHPGAYFSEVDLVVFLS